MFNILDQSAQFVLDVLENGSVYRCPRCPKSYMQKRTLMRHLRYECGKLPQFSCILCSYKSKHRSHITRHLINVHNQVLQETLTDNSFINISWGIEWFHLFLAFQISPLQSGTQVLAGHDCAPWQTEILSLYLLYTSCYLTTNKLDQPN